MNLELDIFTKFDKQWALLTAGDETNFNTMTISWGGLGTLWGKPIATTYVRESRYTREFMDNNDYFTVSFYPEEYKKVLTVMGSKSGRDIDKMNESGLTPEALGQSMTFKEAEMTLVCKKLTKQLIEPDNMPQDVKDMFYGDEDWHYMYIGEVVDIIK
ncbi:MAG: flavin reductase [Eubacterium sp.]|nr:flavin reductase [Eubacterium sp.]